MLPLSFVFSAFFAGIVMFFAPCTLPVLPGYLAYISGFSISEAKEKSGRAMRKKIFLHSIFFLLGFSFVFILLGVSAAFVGAIFVEYQSVIARISGVFILFFALYLLGFFRFSFFEKSRRFRVGDLLARGKFLSSFLFGATFAFGWSPCIGPILGAILFLASSSATVLHGGFLLLIFSLGFAIPFLLLSFFYSYALSFIDRYSKYFSVATKIGGVLLLFIALLLLFDRFELLIVYGYRIFDFINYEALMNYL